MAPPPLAGPQELSSQAAPATDAGDGAHPHSGRRRARDPPIVRAGRRRPTDAAPTQRSGPAPS